jgi:hypothetical protein
MGFCGIKRVLVRHMYNAAITVPSDTLKNVISIAGMSVRLVIYFTNTVAAAKQNSARINSIIPLFKYFFIQTSELLNL